MTSPTEATSRVVHKPVPGSALLKFPFAVSWEASVTPGWDTAAGGKVSMFTPKCRVGKM